LGLYSYIRYTVNSMRQHSETPGCGSFFQRHFLLICWQHRLLSSFDLRPGITKAVALALGWWDAFPCSARKSQCRAAVGVLWYRLCCKRPRYFLSLSFHFFLPDVRADRNSVRQAASRGKPTR